MDKIFIKHCIKKQKFKPHFHNNYSIGLILKGEHKLNINNKKELILPGELKIINPNEIHYVDENSQWSYINLLLEKDIIYEIASHICTNIDKDINFKTKIQDKNLSKDFLLLYEEKNSLKYEELLIEFIEKLLINYSTFENNTKIIDANILKAVEFIHRYFLENINLDEIANTINLSKYHIIKLFKKKFNLTPHQYILRLRIEYGITLIKKGYSLSEIALHCGFSDQSHFIKEFKAIYGCTPSVLFIN